MPQVIPTTIRAFAHCPHARCSGYQQEQVDAIRIETQFLYTDSGGDLPGFERSNVVLAYTDDAEGHPSEIAPCPECGTRRELSETPRRQYDNLSGYAPDYLISKGAQRFDAAKKDVPQDDSRVKDLEGQVAALSGQVEALLSKLTAPAEEG
jgi:hypothetical protein